ncbi:MAG: DUF262 domain-containing protein [Phormidesmis sp.]
MARNNLLDTRTTSFSELISNGRIYRVPTYQRDYAWQEDNWEDLWLDILASLAEFLTETVARKRLFVQSLSGGSFDFLSDASELYSLESNEGANRDVTAI